MPFFLHVDASDPRPIYTQIMDEIRRAVVSGTIAPDDPLPSVRSLAGDLKVNPNTVQQAYRELEREGILYVKRGQGNFVAPFPDDSAMRARVCREIARTALREAVRSGIGAAALIAAIREAAGPRHLVDETAR